MILPAQVRSSRHGVQQVRADQLHGEFLHRCLLELRRLGRGEAGPLRTPGNRTLPFMTPAIPARTRYRPVGDASMRIATWNVEHGASKAKNERRLRGIRELDCDVWILTETHDGLDLGPALPSHHGSRTEQQLGEQRWLERQHADRRLLSARRARGGRRLWGKQEDRPGYLLA